MYYLACPKPECKKKVVPKQSHVPGQIDYFCASCNRLYRSCIPTYFFAARIEDLSDSLTVMFARDNGVPILGGLTPSQFRDFLETETAEPSELFDRSEVVSSFLNSLLVSRDYSILLKAKYETFQGENKLRYFAVKVTPFDKQSKLESSAVWSES